MEEDEAVKRIVNGLERVVSLEPREAKPRYTLRVPRIVITVLNKHPNW